MNKLTRVVRNIDNYQRTHKTAGFLYAVVKKYGDDNGGYQSAVLTYYGLLSLFPLLIVFTSLTKLLLKNNYQLRNRIASSVTNYFPIIGKQLEQSIHSPKSTGIALVISLVITFYGARGIASAIQFSFNSLWNVPRFRQPPFIKNMFRSFSIIIVGGLGLLIAVLLSGYTAVLGKDIFIKIIATLVSLLILWLTFIFLFKLAIAGNKRIKQIIVGSAIAAISLQILQTVGNAILAHELKGLNSEYGTFALVIGLLFWIYLQAQVILYAVEVDVVRAYKLYPRSLQGQLTEGDETAYTRYAKSAKQRANQTIEVEFKRD